MTVIGKLLSRLKPRTFQINYSAEYNTFHPHHIAYDPQHPLSILQRRKVNARPKEGLWWSVTNRGDLSKSSVVRSWCRRRLRNAFTDELKKRGFNENGKLMNAKVLIREDKAFEPILEKDGNLSLTGSVRMQIQPALITTKYADLRKETNGLVGILLESIKADSGILPEGIKADSNSLLHSTPHSQKSPPAYERQSQPHAQSNARPRSKPLAQSNVQMRSRSPPQSSKQPEIKFQPLLKIRRHIAR